VTRKGHQVERPRARENGVLSDRYQPQR
jgi:hypothetical protein